MLQPGDSAPDFELSDPDGRAHALSALLAKGPVVVYFYPVDFSPICTAQACFCRDHRAELEQAGLQVVGVSGQSPRSHARFRKTFGLDFTLLTDPGRRVARAYGAVSCLGLYPRRVSYLIDESGAIIDAVLADWRAGPHTQFIQRAIAWARQRQREADAVTVGAGS